MSMVVIITQVSFLTLFVEIFEGPDVYVVFPAAFTPSSQAGHSPLGLICFCQRQFSVSSHHLCSHTFMVRLCPDVVLLFYCLYFY